MGERVTLACDTHRPKRVHLVVEVDHHGAWLHEEGSDHGAFCLNPTAEHTPAAELQGALW